jgi:hypothetical protein
MKKLLLLSMLFLTLFFTSCSLEEQNNINILSEQDDLSRGYYSIHVGIDYGASTSPSGIEGIDFCDRYVVFIRSGYASPRGCWATQAAAQNRINHNNGLDGIIERAYYGSTMRTTLKLRINTCLGANPWSVRLRWW